MGRAGGEWKGALRARPRARARESIGCCVNTVTLIFNCL